ncbi:dethiobiotin synthase [Bowmanella denitrificans]|uniref:dethiobiotin synthase n=1 Tax=Bowmanella denitrificans TaxID=366582 RepID=UPI000C9CA38E|nr:dethiobiotin synthase [Bowmanella denitrificans]
MRRFFVTGTDTEVGKTFVSQAILHQLKDRRLQTVAFKPVASGCEFTADGLRNSDAIALQQAASIAVPYELVNPVAFAEPVAPHIAAHHAGTPIDFAQLEQALVGLSSFNPDILLVEGAGGWRLPLGQGRFLSEFVVAQQMQVILVVGMRLGCLNHALLTAEAIRRDGLQLVGWVANQVEVDMPYQAENLSLLEQQLNAPLLGHIPRLSAAKTAHQYLDLTPLI